MREYIRHAMMICIGLNVGIICAATIVGSPELVFVGAFSIASCAVGFALNAEDDDV